MSASIKLVDKLEGVENFYAWKYRIGLILEENELARFVKEELLEPEDAAKKAKHQKDTIRTKRIIADSIKDPLVPYVSSKKTPKEMFDALTRLYEGKNINRKMNLRTQLKNARMQKGEMIQEYFSRISEFKEQLEAIGDTIDEDELIMTALNGLTRPWDAFIQTICVRKEKSKFDSLWEECIQEETRVTNREALLARDDDQALATHTKGGRKKPYFQKETHKEPQQSNKFNHKESHPRRFQKKGQRKEIDYSSVQCYHCDKMGHIAKFCPARREEYKRKQKRLHAHVAEDEEPPAKMMREEIKDHVLISSLLGSVTPGEDSWLIDCGASKHMTGQRNILSCISEKKFSQKVTLGDDYQYPIKGVGESNHTLNSRNSLKMKDVLYVPSLKKNLLSISTLEKKGFRVAFIDGEVLMWAKGETLNQAIVIGNEENGLYKLKGHSEAVMTHVIENSSELWHRTLAHINYKALPYICKAVTGLLELKGDHKGVCNGCAQGKNIKNPFPKRDNKTEGVLELIHSDVCGPMPSSSISGYVYYVSFIDDYSRKTWIYFLMTKDEVISKFKEFKALKENISERKIKILRSDNGGEYTSKEFVNFYKDVGIKRELTTPYNPQQNGVAQRKNRTILEAVKEILDLIQSEVCGPMTVASLNGYLYYVLFIDDHSRKTWIYFLKNKDGVLAKFQEFKAQVETMIGKKIKVLRSENGGEYTSKEFINFCIEAGIKRELTVPYNPQQNGDDERKNRIIIEATKAMIHDQSLPMTLWAEACMTTVYVQNHSPHQILKNITPEEAFTKVKPEIGDFRIFGCLVYLHVPKEKRSKLEPSGRKATFVGYSESSKSYRIYIPGQRQIEVSRDVTFEEEVAFQKSKEAQMEIDGETIPPPHSTVQRETNIVPDEPTAPVDLVPPADSVAPSNIPRDITIGHKIPAWARQTLEEAERHKAPQGATRESKRPKRFASYLSAMTHIIDSKLVMEKPQVSKYGKMPRLKNINLY
jgi:transposase InsO family protein